METIVLNKKEETIMMATIFGVAVAIFIAIAIICNGMKEEL